VAENIQNILAVNPGTRTTIHTGFENRLSGKHISPPRCFASAKHTEQNSRETQRGHVIGNNTYSIESFISQEKK
jgi:hypothetical protein